MSILEYWTPEIPKTSGGYPINIQQSGVPTSTPTPMEVVNDYQKMKWEKMEKDAVNSPDHYNNGGIECIAYLKDNMSWEGFTGYLEGNTKKYLHRWRYKSKPLEDLKKARWYLDRLITELEGE